MKKVVYMLLILFAAASFQGCDSGKKSEADKDAAHKRAHKGENAQEVQD